MTNPSLYEPVEYEDSQHRYSYGGHRYLSATQIVEKFCVPFDALAVATRYAQKNGFTAQYWMDQWEQKNLRSKERGNYIHAANELSLHGRMIDRWQGQTITVQGDSITDAVPWIQRPDGVYLERKVWHHGMRTAGRVDKIILYTDPNNRSRRYVDIQDYKTNERLEKVSYQFKGSGNYKMMLPPLGYIMDSNWWHYQLQLSLYMFMMEYQGFIPGEMAIIYYPHPTADDKGNLVDPPRQIHPVTYMKKEVLSMLSYLRRA